MVFNSVWWVASDTRSLLDGVWRCFHQRRVFNFTPAENNNQGSWYKLYTAIKDYFVAKWSRLKSRCLWQQLGHLLWQAVTQDSLHIKDQTQTFQSSWNIIASFTNRLYAWKLWDLTVSWGLLLRLTTPFEQRIKHYWSFKLFLEGCTAEHGDWLFHADVQRLSQGKLLKYFLSWVKSRLFWTQGKGTKPYLTDTEWLLDVAFLTCVTEN